MNRKGQMGVGLLVVVAVAVIVGMVLLQQSAQNVGSMTNTITGYNKSLGATVADDTAQYLTDVKSISSIVVYNETGGVAVAAGNYTITNNVVYQGQEAVKVLPGTVTAGWKSKWQITGTAQPLTYDSSGGGRVVAGIIIIFFALAIAVVVLVAVVKNNVLDF